MSRSILHVPEKFRRGGRKENENESVTSGFDLLQLMCKKLDIADLAGKDLLDMGCGNKFTQAILEGGLRDHFCAQCTPGSMLFGLLLTLGGRLNP